jgi:DNA-directed RNA polymerase specialized sigma24 family protein
LIESRWSLTQEGLERLLAWLGPDRDSAGDRYEDVRHRLIRIFTQRGCHEAEDLADETINRVVKKIAETDLTDTYDGDPALYFYGVAKKVFKEYLARRPKANIPAPTPGDDVEWKFECLEGCLDALNTEGRELILQYYQGAKRRKIDHRKQLAQQLGIGATALRIRACRIRAVLDKCIRECINQEQMKRESVGAL